MKPPQGYESPYDNPLHLPTWFFLQKAGDLHALVHESTVIRNKNKNGVKNKTYRLIGTTTITSYDMANDLPQTLSPELNIIRAIKTEDYIAIIENIALRVTAYAIAQIYEYFETFLFDILAVHQIEKNVSYKGKEAFDMIRAQLKIDLRGRNNGEVLKMIRNESEIYRSHETNNVGEINLMDWNAVFSLVRHSITHANMVVKSEGFDKLQSHQQVLFRKMFPCIAAENEFTFTPTFETLVETIRTASAHVILIFRGLSSCLGFESHPIFHRG
jgi:hypothetical protein